MNLRLVFAMILLFCIALFNKPLHCLAVQAHGAHGLEICKAGNMASIGRADIMLCFCI